MSLPVVLVYGADWHAVCVVWVLLFVANFCDETDKASFMVNCRMIGCTLLGKTQLGKFVVMVGMLMSVVMSMKDSPG